MDSIIKSTRFNQLSGRLIIILTLLNLACCVICYVIKIKNGFEDLNKAIHYIQILIEQTFVPKNEDAVSAINDFCIANQLIG